MSQSQLILYHNYWSICSIMTRYTWALRGPPKDTASDVLLLEKAIDIQGGEQLSEQCLCEINPRGEVPVLAGGTLKQPLPDSLAITYYFAGLFPGLIPSAYQQDITLYLEELHDLNFFSLSFAGQPGTSMTHGIVGAIQQRLEGNISQRYRKALEYKLKVTTEGHHRFAAVEPEAVEAAVQTTRVLLERLSESLTSEISQAGEGHGEDRWLFGAPQPTALDGWVIPLIKRLQDVNRESLVPSRLLDWAGGKMKQKEWIDLMEDRVTMFVGERAT